VSLFAALLAIAAPAQSDAAPPAAVALLSAIESGDADAARALLAREATIADSSSGTGELSTLEALSAYGRGCTHSDLVWEHDPESGNAVATLNWSCPSRAPSQTFVWTSGPRVTWVQFGLPAPALAISE
jgi:hypothetical protein